MHLKTVGNDNFCFPLKGLSFDFGNLLPWDSGSEFYMVQGSDQ